MEVGFHDKERVSTACGSSPGWKKPIWTSNLIILLVIITITVVIFLGNFHIITGGGVGLKVAKRDSFGFTESFIDVNAITGMPWIAAQYRYPYGCRVLAREGIIESNDEFKKRITRDMQQEINKTMRSMDLYR